MSELGNGMSLHPLNREFSWQDAPETGLRLLTPELVRQFNKEGFFKLEGVFTADEIARLTDEIDPIESAVEAYIRDANMGMASEVIDSATFATHLVNRSQVLRNFAKHPVFQDICHDLCGPRVRLYWDQCVYKKSGKPQEFPWHQDNGYTYIEPQQYITCWTPLVDVDEENGCPWVAPGIHKLGTLSHWQTPIGLKCIEQPDNPIPVPAKAGDLIVFSSLTPHRTGPNLKQGTVRKAYILQYAPDGACAYKEGEAPQLQDDPKRQFIISDQVQ